MNIFQPSGNASWISPKAVGHPFELAPEVGLPGVVDPVGEPHGERRRAELLAELDAIDVVLDGSLAHVGRRVGERAEFVADLAVCRGRRVVLERVRVHRIEPDAEVVGVLAQRRRVVGIVPRDVQADRSVGAGDGVQGGDVVELLDGVPRLAAAREAAESGASGADRPRRGGDAEALHLGDDRLDVDVPASETLGAGLEVRLVSRQLLGLDVGNCPCRDSRCHLDPPPRRRAQPATNHLKNAAATPPSTGIDNPVVRDRLPPTSTNTASATCSGTISRPSSVRPA